MTKSNDNNRADSALRDGGPERATSSKRVLIIEAGKASKTYWTDVWHFRELFAVLAWRDILVRYKQTVIGVAWALIRPLLTMLVFSFIFNRVAGLPSEGTAPYMLMVLAGTLPWFLFATAISEGANSLVAGASMVQKIYFPRIIMPTAAAAVAVVDLFISLGLFAIFALFMGFLPDWRIVFLPLFVLAGMFAGLGPALLLSSLTVRYRDFRFIVPFIVQFGLYVSPVGFATSAVPEKYQLLFHINPMVGVIDGFRWSLLRGEAPLNPLHMAISLIVAIAIFWLGYRNFRKTERLFADLV